MDLINIKQLSLAHTGFERVTKRTRKRIFLEEMNLVIPWSELLGLLAPHAPPGKTGLPPFAQETMLRINFLQQWFGLSDPAMEDACHGGNAKAGENSSRTENPIVNFPHDFIIWTESQRVKKRGGCSDHPLDF